MIVKIQTKLVILIFFSNRFDLATSQGLTRPVPSGYALALSLQNLDPNRSSTPRESRHGRKLRQNRMTISTNLPTQEELKKIKHDKKVRCRFVVFLEEELLKKKKSF